MLTVRGKIVGFAAFLALFAGSYTVEAASLPITVSCPGTAVTTDREFSVTGTVETAPLGDATITCYASDPGQLNDDEFADPAIDPAWVLIDKDETGDAGDGACVDESCLTITGLGSTSGIFTISSGTWGTYNELLLGFKVGAAVGQNIDPDWAAFLLTGGITDGTWSVSNRNGLSHATLWGRFVPDRDIQAIPEPATLVLVGSGILAAVRKRRRTVR
jgi:hypothetical protein